MVCAVLRSFIRHAVGFNVQTSRHSNAIPIRKLASYGDDLISRIGEHFPKATSGAKRQGSIGKDIKEPLNLWICLANLIGKCPTIDSRGTSAHLKYREHKNQCQMTYHRGVDVLACGGVVTPRDFGVISSIDGFFEHFKAAKGK
jgi:hypothetical protein